MVTNTTQDTKPIPAMLSGIKALMPKDSPNYTVYYCTDTKEFFVKNSETWIRKNLTR